jgi:hypothetical protein
MIDVRSLNRSIPYLPVPPLVRDPEFDAFLETLDRLTNEEFAELMGGRTTMAAVRARRTEAKGG